MDRSRRVALGLALVVLTAGCAQIVGGDPLEVTPAPVPTDESTVDAGPRPVVEVVNHRPRSYGVTVTVVEGPLDRVEITWVNDITSAIEAGGDDGSPVQQLTTRDVIRHVDPPSDASLRRRSGEIDGHGRLRLAGPAAGRAAAMIVEVRPTDGTGSYVGFPEPLLAAVVVTCQRDQPVDVVRLEIDTEANVDVSAACEPTR